MNDVMMIYFTAPSKEVAHMLVEGLLKERLIGCATTMPSSSTYWWQGKITHSEEIVVFAKTTVDVVDEAQMFIEENHPYDVPCSLIIPAEASSSYAQWLLGEVAHYG